VLADRYEYGEKGFPRDRTKAMELFTRAAELRYTKAHSSLGGIYHEGGNLKKAKFHFEAAAMAGHEGARFNIGSMEAHSGNMERANKHWMIVASAGSHNAMQNLQHGFELGVISRKSIDSTLTAYNSSCAEMRSEARDACIHCQLTRLLVIFFFSMYLEGSMTTKEWHTDERNGVTIMARATTWAIVVTTCGQTVFLYLISLSFQFIE